MIKIKENLLREKFRFTRGKKTEKQYIGLYNMYVRLRN